MKKFYPSLFAAFAMLAVGCTPGTNEEDPKPDPTPDTGGTIKEFVVEIDAPTTRAAVESNNAFVWSANDAITVVRFDSPTTRPKLVQCTIDNNSINGNSAKFTTLGIVNEVGEQYAVYPKSTASVANFATGSAETGRLFTISLPEQSVNAEGKINYPILVGAYDNSTKSFKMKNPLALLQLTFKTPASESIEYTLNSITVSGNNGEKMWGDVVVSTADMVATTNKATQTECSITYNSVKVGKNGTVLNIFIPMQNYSKGLTVAVKCTEGVMTKTILEGGVDASNSKLVEAEVALELEKSPVLVQQVFASDTTIAIGWTTDEKNGAYIGEVYPNSAANYAEDIKKEFKVALYRDAACTNLYASVQRIPGSTFSNIMAPRFVFTGLTPNTEYYAMVYNLTDSKQNIAPIKVATVASADDKSNVVTTANSAKDGDMLVCENFAGLLYGGEVSARAAGLSRSDRGDMTTIVKTTGDITVSDQGFMLVAATTEIGLFNTLKGILDDMNLNKWGWIGGKSGANGGSICARPGYVEVGTTDNCSFICTPILNAIPAEKCAKLKVVFKAAPYGDANKLTLDPAEKVIAVKALAGASLGTDYAMSYSKVVAEQTLTLEGDKNIDWKEYTVTLKGVPSGSSIAIGGGLDATTTNRLLLDDVRVYVESLENLPPVSGTIRDQSGNPVAGVVVTDGYSVVKSDSNGKYEITRNNNAKFIYYTTPAEYEIALAADGYPLFFKSITDSDLDFTLGEKISKHNKWHLYVMADPQTNQTGKNCIPYFSKYIAADIKALVEKDGFNSAKDWNGARLAYGMVLGDVIWNSAKESYMTSMKNAMAPAATNVSWFTVPGNHDWYSTDSDTNPSLNCFHKVFGPDRYSFDRGDVHVVGMNNVITGPGTAVEDYGEGFTADEYQWLKNDLAMVPKDKCVVLCVHIPFFDGESGVRHSKYYTETLNLLKQYTNAYILSGHNHYTRHWFHTSYNNIHEVNHGSACGLFWNLKVCADGTPAGYYLYTFEGNDCTDQYFKVAGTADYRDGANALRMYLGSDSYDPRMLCSFGKGNNVVYANLFNGYLNKTSDASALNKPWSIELYYKGSKVMDMVNVTKSNSSYGYHDKPSDYEDKYYSTWLYNSNYLRNDADWWCIARAIHPNTAIKNRDGNKWGGALSNSSYKKTTTHIYAGTLPEGVTIDSSDVMIRATAPTGQVYEVTKFTKFSSFDGVAWELY